MNIPQQAVCTSRCCYYTDVILLLLLPLPMLQYRNGTVRQKYIHGWEVKSPRIYCKQQWWFRFFIKSRLLLFIFHVQLYFPFFPMMFCSVRCCCRRIAMCAFFSLSLARHWFFSSHSLLLVIHFFCAAVHRTTNTVYEQRTRIEDEFESLLLFFSSLSLDTFCIAHNKTAWLRLFQLYYTTIAC